VPDPTPHPDAGMDPEKLEEAYERRAYRRIEELENV
jgi:hypothetical protein